MSKYLIKEILIILIISMITLIFIDKFLFGFYVVHGDSMENTYHNGDLIFVLKKEILSININKDFSILRDKIVIVESNSKMVIKRCIGIENDTIIINLTEKTDTIIIPSGKIFLMGDNIESSIDSRQKGFFDIKDIEGISLFNGINLKNGNVK